MSAGNGGRLVFVTHSAAAAGAELLMMRMLRGGTSRPAHVIFLEAGDLVGAFGEAGIAAEVLSLPGLRAFRRESGLGGAARQLPALPKAVRALSARIRPGDTVVASSQKALVLLSLVRLARRDFALVWWLHDVLDPSHFSRLSVETGVRLSRRFCSKVIANSIEARDAYVRAGGAAGRVGVVEPGIDLDEFSPPTGPAEPEAPPIIVSVSRVAPWKGQATLVEAMASVPGAEAWIVGAPLFGETACLDRLKARISALGLEDRVRLLGHRDDVAGLLRQAAIFVHVPDAVEPFGQVVVEAMASGVPAVVSDAGAPARIVSGGGGLTVPPGDPTRLAFALRALLADEGARRRMGARGAELARAYDIARMRETFYEQLKRA